MIRTEAKRAALAALPLLSGALAGCAEEAPTPRTDAPPPAQEQSGHAEQLDELRALGYVGYAEALVEADEDVVPVFDPERSAKGYNLVSNRDLCSAQLIDPRGNVVHSWKDREADHWSNAELLDTGELLVTGSFWTTAEGRALGFVLRMSWAGEVIWRRRMQAHHDAELTPDGKVATLLAHYRRIPAIAPDTDVKDHRLILLSSAGRPLEVRSLYDLLGTDPSAFEFQRVERMTEDGRDFIDLLHPNSIEFMRHEHLAARDPLYASGNVLVSIRHQDTIAVFDWAEQRLVWAWGQGEISGQHDATVLENGNILLFDNGMVIGRSRVIELDPIEERIVWQYEAPDPEDFFSLRKGSSQRLANGNTLIANSDSGEAFEVTAKGETVWLFRNPKSSHDGHRATIVRIKRYPVDFVERLLGD